jgi:hypothetical protein
LLAALPVEAAMHEDDTTFYNHGLINNLMLEDCGAGGLIGKSSEGKIQHIGLLDDPSSLNWCGPHL